MVAAEPDFPGRETGKDEAGNRGTSGMKKGGSIEPPFD
jgi:hypothetical protein